MIRCIIIDDEVHCRATLKKLLEWSDFEIEILAEATNGLEGLELLNKHTPDILFLDIEMPHLDGLSMLEKLGRVDFPIIFTTAYDEYALEAFRFHAVNYLLKPIDVDELNSTLERIQNKPQLQIDVIRNIITDLQQDIVFDKLAIPTIDGAEFIPFDKIIRAESESNYSKIYCEGGRQIIMSRTLKRVLERLPSKQFYRCHNSHVINLSYIKKLTRGKQAMIELENGDMIPLSRQKKDELMQLLQL